MNFKTTYILFGILLVVLGAFLISQLFVKPPHEEESDYVLPGLHEAKINANDITSVEIKATGPKYPAENLVFVRRGNGWRVQGSDVRADRVAVDQVVSDVMNASQSAEEKGADVTSDLKRFGLEPPGLIVTLRQGSERQWQLNVGDVSLGKEDAVVYVNSSDRPRDVIAIRRSKLSSLFVKDEPATAAAPKAAEQPDRYRLKTLADFRSRDLLGEGAFNLPETATELVLRAAKAQAVVLKKEEGNRWHFVEPKLGEADYEGDAATTGPGKPPAGVKDLLRDLGELKVATSKPGQPGSSDEGGTPEFVKDHAEDLASYGLAADRPSTLKIELRRSAGGQVDQAEPVQESLLIGNKDGDRYFARLGNENSVVKIAADKLEPILQAARDPNALRSHDLVSIEASKIDAIDITNASGTVRLRRPQPAVWSLLGAGGKERNADNQAAQDLVSAFTARRLVQSFPKPAPDAEHGFDHPTAVVALWAGGLRKDEKAGPGTPGSLKSVPPAVLKDEQHPTVRLTFGKKEGASVYVRRQAGNETADLTVPATILDKVNQPAVAYLDRTLPTFPESAEVTRIVLERGGETFDLQKSAGSDKGAGGWKFQKPADLSGRQADAKNVDRIIRELRGLVAEKLVAEAPSPAELHRFGLEPPEIRVVITVRGEDKKTQDHVYLIGKETEDHAGRHARQGQAPLVFVVRPTVADVLRSELQDPTVFRFEPESVHELKVSGWRKVQGFNVTLQLQRQGPGNWAVKQPDGFELDQAQAEGFVRTLSGLRADRVVVRRSGPKPEFKLDPKERALFVEVTVEGQKAPLTLTIGELDAKDKGYYAESSTRPGDVFLLPQEPFEKILAGIRYFSRQADIK